MTLMHASENKAFRLVVVFLMIFALALTVARPARAIAVTSILIPAVIATLGAWGIGTAAEGLDGDQIAEWFHEKLTSWETAAEISLANIATGIKMTPLGQVLLNPFALAGIREFGAWLIQQEGLVAGGSSVDVITSGLSAKIPAGITPLFTSGGATYSLRTTSEVAYAFLTLENGVYYLYGAAKPSEMDGQNLQIDVLKNGARQSWITVSYRQNVALVEAIYNRSFSASSTSYPDTLPVFDDVNAGIAYILNPPPSEGSLALVPSAEMDVPTAADVQDKELLLNTSLDVGADAAAWYESVMQKVAANDLTVTGTLTQAGTITADQVLDQGAIREEDGVVMWPDVVQPIGVTGLDEIFPFCIPFDIYHFCQALAAEPVAPSFDVPFRIEGIVDYTFHLDLEDFDQVAALLRTLELLLFCVGLAFVTRSMFIRG